MEETTIIEETTVEVVEENAKKKFIKKVLIIGGTIIGLVIALAVVTAKKDVLDYKLPLEGSDTDTEESDDVEKTDEAE